MKIRFRINYITRWGESLAIVLEDNKYPMQWETGGNWTAELEVRAAALKDYTYVVMENGLVSRTEWQHHSAKAASVIEDSWTDCPVPGCLFPQKHQAAMFDRPGFKGAGTVIPVFSLRSAKDFGIGEFNDLMPLIDWAAATGQCIIQLLPVTDTTRCGDWKDSYPYSPVSSFALHPMYINLQDIGVKESEAFRRQRAELNALPKLDYPRVYKAKMAYVREAYESRGAKDLAGAAYARFYKANAYWLGEYAEFCARRDGNEPEYHAWVQFHLDRQFGRVADYARSKGIALKGDLPIGVSGESADAFWHPELFNMDSCAGAPPDYFSADGQNWGFPTYNWEVMAQDDYSWWKSRLRRMSRWFDAFRIDHVLGFFRIWEIPSQYKSGTMGHFNPALPYTEAEIKGMGLPMEGLFHEDPRNEGCFQPLITPDTTGLSDAQRQCFDGVWRDFFFRRHDEFWRVNAMRKLPELLGATGMLACAEDLGMVPDCVPGVLWKEKILSLKMRGMEGEGQWPYLSVCATSSHDMPTLRMQFEHDPQEWEVRNELSRFLYSESMLAIFPLQDWLALDVQLRRHDRDAERINCPDNPDHHWCYRMHIGVEDLLQAETFNLRIASLIDGCGRKHYICKG